VANALTAQPATDHRMPPQGARVVAAPPTRRKTTGSANKMLVRSAIYISRPHLART